MNRIAAALSVVLVAAVASSAAAQQRPGVALDKRWPDPSAQPRDEEPPDPDEEILRGSRRSGSPAPRQQTTTGAVPEQPAPTGIKPQPAPPRVVNCGGVFARDSSHIKLATFFGADAITWGQVAGPEGTKLNASVLYPRDPKRRLEVLWNLDASRSDTQLIVINGQSTWTAPHGIKLGMPITAIEKINKKTFNLKGFGGEDGGFVTSWESGALASLPGGCKISIRFAPDPKAKTKPDGDLAGEKQFPSNHPNLRGVDPKVTEIILGY
jgi:hypothetical protein